MKEPGQIAYEASVKNVNQARPYSLVHGMERTVWEDVERACRAEGLREAVRIARALLSHTNGSMHTYEADVEDAILSAIGDSQ